MAENDTSHEKSKTKKKGGEFFKKYKWFIVAGVAFLILALWYFSRNKSPKSSSGNPQTVDTSAATPPIPIDTTQGSGSSGDGSGSGTPGPAGPPGAAGATGNAGAAGTPGSSGARGATGGKGERGKRGERGRRGKPAPHKPEHHHPRHGSVPLRHGPSSGHHLGMHVNPGGVAPINHPVHNNHVH